MTASDVKVQLTDNNTLTISGSRKQEHEEKTDKMHRVERSYGRFSRSFSLPPDADASKITANVDNGVVHVTIPKMKEAPSRVTDIPVTARPRL